MPKICITDHYCFPNDLPEQGVFESAGFEWQRIAPECKTEDDVINACGDADALLVLYAPITRRVLESLPRVKCISRYGIGVNNFDLDACRDLGVTAANVPDYCIEEVSNHALAMAFALARRIPHDHNSILKGDWNINQFRPIYAFSDMVLGLVSFGKLARAVAVKAQVFGFKVIAFDPIIDDSVFAQTGVERVGFDDLVTQSDIISIHCPLVPETTHLVNTESISRMKDGVIIVNTARGPVIDEPALIAALESGKVAGAGLDVFEKEPLPIDSPLRQFPGVLLTSHSAWMSERAMISLQTKAAEAARDYLQGKCPGSAVVWCPGDGAVGKTAKSSLIK